MTTTWQNGPEFCGGIGIIPLCVWPPTTSTAHIEKSHEALLDTGAEAQQEVKDVGGGKLMASMKDADGNVVGLIQPA